MHREVDRCQVGCAGLGLLAIRLNGAAYASPDVDLVRQFERNLEIVVANAIERRAVRLPVGGAFVASCRGGGGDGWKIISPVIAQNCASLSVLGFSRLQILVRDV